MEVARPVLSFEQARALAAEHGTPLMVYSLPALRENYRMLKNAMPGVELYYAVKANYEDCILTTLLEEGCNIDICSVGELERTLRLGFTVDRMIHTHPCKDLNNMRTSYAAGVRWYTYDCVAEAEKMLTHAKDLNLILRLKASGESSLIDLSAKYGCAIEEAELLIDQTIALGGTIKGLAFHVGSQCHDTKDYLAMLKRVRGIWDMCIAKGCPMEVLDVGGGFPAPYREPMIHLEDFARQVYQHIQTTFGDVQARFIAEPGRGLVARNATMVTSIISKNVRNGDTWFFIDEGVYGCFSGIFYDHVTYELLYDTQGKDMPLSTCMVAGPTCDSVDIISRKEHLLPKDMQIGDLLLAPTMGAYTSATATTCFNGLPRAKNIILE